MENLENKMLQDSSQKISSLEFKHFLRHICIASKKHKEKEEARQDLSNQLNKIKKISLDKKAKKNTVEKELDSLNKKIDMVLQKEGVFLKNISMDEDIIRKLKHKVNSLEKNLSTVKEERDLAINSKNNEVKDLTLAITKIRSRMNKVLKN